MVLIHLKWACELRHAFNVKYNFNVEKKNIFEKYNCNPLLSKNRAQASGINLLEQEAPLQKPAINSQQKQLWKIDAARLQLPV